MQLVDEIYANKFAFSAISDMTAHFLVTRIQLRTRTQIYIFFFSFTLLSLSLLAMGFCVLCLLHCIKTPECNLVHVESYFVLTNITYIFIPRYLLTVANLLLPNIALETSGPEHVKDCV
jgi:hypothetical protein